jgi:chromosome segregation ATPase
MPSEQNSLNEVISSLKQQRDELALKMHLAEAEAKEEFESAANKLDQLTSDYAPLKHALAESAESIVESLKLVADEVMNSFDRIRKSLRN